MASDLRRTERTRVRRNAARGAYDRDTIYGILDAGVICHVSYVENAEPRLIPTAYMRRGDSVYLHGNRQSAVLRAIADGATVAIAVTLLDGLVAARSGFHCSMNYRSVVLFGEGEEVGGELAERYLDEFVDALIPGHGAAVRPPTRQELAATRLVRVPIDDASAKVRIGDPIDADEDLGSDIWAGVVPVVTRMGAAIPSADLAPGLNVPDYIEKLAQIEGDT